MEAKALDLCRFLDEGGALLDRQVAGDLLQVG
jgi:hypothetical protein